MVHALPACREPDLVGNAREPRYISCRVLNLADVPAHPEQRFTHFLPKSLLILRPISLIDSLQLRLRPAAQDLDELFVVGAQTTASFMHHVCAGHDVQLLYIKSPNCFWLAHGLTWTYAPLSKLDRRAGVMQLGRWDCPQDVQLEPDCDRWGWW